MNFETKSHITNKISHHVFRDCIICGSYRLHFAFTLKEHRIVRCGNCGFMLINPQPSDDILGQIYGGDYFIFSENEDDIRHAEELKQSTANKYLSILIGDTCVNSASLLEISCGDGNFICRAASLGLKVTGVDYSQHACVMAKRKLQNGQDERIQDEINLLSGEQERFDYIVFCDTLEHVRDPRAFLHIVFDLLKPNGSILCVVPSLDTWPAKLLKTNWMNYKLEHLFYFDTKNLRSILFQNGFTEFRHFKAKKALSIDYIAGHFAKYPVPFWSKLLRAVRFALPQSLLRKEFSVTGGEIGIIAKKRSIPENLRLSVIMAVYNEINTIRDGIERVLNKQMQGIDIELILIESNSTDGTKDVVDLYKDHPRVKTVSEQIPCGKGHAVRAGLEAATGDFILIQDADDEYDIEDYDALLEPLISGREAFVLGARHGASSWKMRKFSGQPILTILLNSGHYFFATLVNILYWVRLKDPFTMYKVFRRDCIQNVSFECNRFDFDCELLIKLIRKGFKPIEIPVCYRSRSFAEGKKVRIFADPWTWLKAIIKYRFVTI